MTRHRVVPASYLVLMKENKILLLRRFNTGYEDGKYSMVAGHLDGKESFIQAIIREAKEEANIIIKPDDLEVVHSMNRNAGTDNERIDVFIQAKKWGGDIKLMEPNKCDEMKWFNLDSLPENTIPYIRHVIECIKNRIHYSEYGF